MKSFIGNSSSVRGWALLLALLLGAGMMISACGEEDVPAPTTPTPPPAPPPPAPEPEPTPDPPATPTGLHVDEATASSITWHWNAVEGATGYVVQASTDETFDDTVLGNPETVLFNGLPFTTETSYTATDLGADTRLYVRVAAAAGTADAPLVSNFSTHVTGMTRDPGPPVPANLRQTAARGSDFLEWEWDAVEGASGYVSQFSTSSTFPAGTTDWFWHSANDRTRKVSNRSPESDGYLRVRSYTGTQAEPTLGAWTASSMLTTEEAPPATQLPAPTGLEVDDRDDDSITLAWDRVRNAGSYLVEQREPGDDDWDDARCEGGDNEVEDEECVASGLTAGTDYDFRVSAVPSDTDRYLTSEPSDILESRTLGTAPRPTTPTPGGMGDLNVEWTSTRDSITFSWDPVAGLQYQWVVLEDPTKMGTADPCEDATFGDPARQFFHSQDGLSANDIRGICVRTSDKDNRATSFAWGIVQPAVVAAPDQADATLSDAGVTTALAWEGTFRLEGGFDYEFHVVADPHSIRGTADASDITSNTSATAIQRACSAAKPLDTGDADVTVSIDEVLMRSGSGLTLTPYTGYLLCFRLANGSGNTEWSVPASNLELYTAPGKPPTPSVDTVRSGESDTANNHEVFWTVGLRNKQQVPRAAAGYEAATITYRQKFVDTDDNSKVKGVPKPKVDACPEDGTSNTSWTRAPLTAISTTTQGIVIESGDIAQPAVDDPDLDHTEVKLCLRATYPTDTAGGLDGPWVITSQRVIPQLPPSN